eukprot:TRINITY_DN8963_c0_g1_i1.p1 TRINITY_DN8963_c0_g1~~TRINITY_DN8963_c0_g1_i1.p1  ORF type:complete len:214 (-),score=51.47 TRINITY_DN8963_c0_g1_i1:66-707(-)
MSPTVQSHPPAESEVEPISIKQAESLWQSFLAECKKTGVDEKDLQNFSTDDLDASAGDFLSRHNVPKAHHGVLKEALHQWVTSDQTNPGILIYGTEKEEKDKKDSSKEKAAKKASKSRPLTAYTAAQVLKILPSTTVKEPAQNPREAKMINEKCPLGRPFQGSWQQKKPDRAQTSIHRQKHHEPRKAGGRLEGRKFKGGGFAKMTSQMGRVAA